MAGESRTKPDVLGGWIKGWDVLAAVTLLAASFLLVRLDAIPQLAALASDKSYFSGPVNKPLLLDTYRHGYAFETVRDHLRALGESGRDYYGHTFIPIYDLALSLFLLTFTVLFILYATQPNKGHALQVPPLVRRLALVPAVLQFLFDVGENLTMRHLMDEYPRISVKVVETASLLTQLKWLTIYLNTAIIIALAVYTLYRLFTPASPSGAKS
jgi:hypothetical protein